MNYMNYVLGGIASICIVTAVYSIETIKKDALHELDSRIRFRVDSHREETETTVEAYRRDRKEDLQKVLAEEYKKPEIAALVDKVRSELVGASSDCDKLFHTVAEPMKKMQELIEKIKREQKQSVGDQQEMQQLFDEINILQGLDKCVSLYECIEAHAKSTGNKSSQGLVNHFTVVNSEDPDSLARVENTKAVLGFYSMLKREQEQLMRQMMMQQGIMQQGM